MFSLGNKNRNSFTLIELLVVLALVAILSVVVVLTLNPAELIKQARDSNRLSDLATINTALNLFSTDVTSGFMGTSTVVYVSIPSASPTCVGLGLPTLPTGYTYNCATSQNLRNTDGTGWIPVNFQRISSNSPISQLPIDPINTTSTRLYYTYVPGGSWELNASIEASKNKLGGSNDLTSKDGGNAVSTYEIGNNLNLSPLETGDSSLVGYWNFEEASGTIAYDRSGLQNDVVWSGSGPQHYAQGKVGNFAAQLNGTDDYMSTTTNAANALANIGAASQPMTVIFWANIQHQDQRYAMSYAGRYLTLVAATSTNACTFGTWGTNTGCQSAVSAAAWTQFSWVWTGGAVGSGSIYIYINGIQTAMRDTLTSSAANSNTFILGTRFGGYPFYQGLIDDFKIYNRALSAAEILATYNAAK